MCQKNTKNITSEISLFSGGRCIKEWTIKGRVQSRKSGGISFVNENKQLIHLMGTIIIKEVKL